MEHNTHHSTNKDAAMTLPNVPAEQLSMSDREVVTTFLLGEVTRTAERARRSDLSTETVMGQWQRDQAKADQAVVTAQRFGVSLPDVARAEATGVETAESAFASAS